MKKPAAKKPAVKSTAKVAAKKAAHARGTVGWLIEQLQKMPADMPVLQGDHDAKFYEPGGVEVLSIREGEIDDEEGESCVCITAW